MVSSWLAGEGGTVAYGPDLKQPRQLIDASEHSDLAFGPDGKDLLVVADYAKGQIAAIDIRDRGAQ